MDTDARRFLWTWVLTCLGFSAAFVFFNVAMDPYLLFEMPRISGLNARKPAVLTEQRLMKAYDAVRAVPKTLLLGNSRVDVGLDTRHPTWPAEDRPAYNLGLGGGTLYISYRYLQHVLSERHPDLVVLDLDFEYFLTTPEASSVTDSEFESRLAVTRDGRPNGRRAQRRRDDFVRAVLSLDALIDSFTTLAGNITGESTDIAAGNWESNDRRFTSVWGSYAFLEAVDLVTLRSWYGQRRNDFAIADLRAILDLCRSKNIRVILFIDPVHADELEILDRLGYWSEFEAWKRELVSLTEQYHGADGLGRIVLWDFSGYYPYCSESPIGGRRGLRWFSESRHYTKALGDAIARRILGAGDARFGEQLTADSLEQHLASIREQRRLYREHHQADAQRVRDLYDAIYATQSPAPLKAH
jgi:hypothetical protein